MNTSIDATKPPYTTTNSSQPQGGDTYIFVIGFFCIVFLLLSLTYTSYICKRSQSPPQPQVTANTNANSHHLIRFSCGIQDDVLVTFPTFLYSNATMHKKGDVAMDSSCAICLADYKPADVVRLLPVCGHLYHVGCVDTWLKVHPTCPMCRNRPATDGVMSSEELSD